ncbi:protein of unknown function [Cupriavidus neocaledonicus]|uniref:Uncharacterized protein n=1 Tax=Cupriavidus neocaledonicus TaxID=1040979 RepID=A0A375HB86_9BURK|nr:hypothetical protein CBM2605_A190035 [Cupriavidus neocaledonicus]SPD47480.1 protein of unknown function [Cupriavidus neocaledonicus]
MDDQVDARLLGLRRAGRDSRFPAGKKQTALAAARAFHHPLKSLDPQNVNVRHGCSKTDAVSIGSRPAGRYRILSDKADLQRRRTRWGRR